MESHSYVFQEIIHRNKLIFYDIVGLFIGSKEHIILNLQSKVYYFTEQYIDKCLEFIIFERIKFFHFNRYINSKFP